VNIVIIEDERPAQRWLHSRIAEVRPDATIVATLASVEESVDWFNNHANDSIDVILADIRLGDGTTFDISEAVPLRWPVVFTTSYDEYAIQAFTLNSIDYLLKPIQTADLARALEKYQALKAIFGGVDTSSILAEVRKLVEPKDVFRERLLVEAGDQLVSIAVTDIAFAYSENKLTHVVTVTGRRHIVDETLDQLEHSFDPRRFFRVNRKYIVRFDAIQSSAALFNGTLRLHVKPSAPHDVTVSRERVSGFKRWLDR
jgi:DNA-binding LytR/AlgR family response regulator